MNSMNSLNSMDHIKYKEGYKYQLVEDFTLLTDIVLPEGTGNKFVWLGKEGMLIVKKWYAWDGPSGPTLDTRDSMRASLVHDALYQLIREEYISRDYREAADKIFLDLLLIDGMLPLRAAAWFVAVRMAAGSAAESCNDNPILTAP